MRKPFELLAERHEHFDAAQKLIAAARDSGKDLTRVQLLEFDKHLAAMRAAEAALETMTAQEAIGAFSQRHNRIPVPGAQPLDGQRPVDMKAFESQLGDFMRHGTIMNADVPLYLGTGAGVESVGATIPTEVLGHIAAYANLDSFKLAGARILDTGDTTPLVVPVVSAGAAASTYVEGTSAIESQPFSLDSFTLGGTKHARLVKVSEEALMNSALPMQSVILDELAAGIATTFTAAITTAMVTALTANAAVLVDQGADDVYHALIELMHAIPPRFASANNKWMLSRATLALVKDSRATDSGVPFFNPESGQIFGHDSVINDNLTGGKIVYGDWGSGAVVRKSPFFLLPLREAFSAQGQVGFKATQWCDQHFLCELSGVSVQPLFYSVLS